MKSSLAEAGERIADARSVPTVAETGSSRRRPIWRISLGAVLIFAAGLMIGFAPMRAWVYFRDDPEYVTIDAILAEMPAGESDGFREAVERANAASTGAVDAEAIVLATPGGRIRSAPTLMTMVGREASFQSGGERFVSLPPTPGQYSFFGEKATFCPRVRPSGTIELDYAISHAQFHDHPNGLPIERREQGIESTVVLRSGEWKAIEVKRLSERQVADDRVQWLLMRVNAP